MLKIITVVAISALALGVTVAPKPAQARNDGAIAAGVVGGLAVGAIVASQPRGYYGGQGYYESGYQPVYGYGGGCHTERQQFEDGYGRIRVRRVRVCD